MTHQLIVTPSGRLLVEDDPGESARMSGKSADEIRTGFGVSNAEGLARLAVSRITGDLPATFVFWRDYARRLFTALCHLPDPAIENWQTLEPPHADELARLAAFAPPARGLEYITPALLENIWVELRDEVIRRAAAAAEGPEAYLASLNPLWHLVGRVTFHLAENKRNAERPFAFLATFTYGTSGAGRLKHLPLAEALKTYVGQKNQSQLDSLLEPVRRASKSSPLVKKLLESRALFAPQAWSVGEAHRFLVECPRIEEAGIVLRIPDWWSVRKPTRPQVRVNLGNKGSKSDPAMPSLLDFNIEIALGEDALTAAERQMLLAGTETLVHIRGKWVEVDREKLHEALEHWENVASEHPQGLGFIEGMRLLAGAPVDPAAEIDEDVAAWSGQDARAGSWLSETLARIRRPGETDGCQPGRNLNATLRPYQADGVRWLWLMSQLGLGGCLADDMGLGKTIQVIDLLLQQRAGGQAVPPSLLVVPASLIGNWKQELARFAPALRVFVVHRSENDDDTLAEVAANAGAALAKFDLVITTYGLARRQEWLAGFQWSLVILDEAQAIKNATSAQTKSVKKLPGQTRLILTGTPVENHLGDLWSLFDFCCPGLLGSAKQFKEYVKRLNKKQDTEGYAALRRLVQPYILRRMKTDPAIVPDLPDKIEMRVECGLSKKQAVLYEQTIENYKQRLEEAEGIARRGLVLALLMHLKQICNHPAQYLSKPDFEPADSAKFERLALLCEPILERQERLLLFTQFQSMTEPLANYLSTVFGRPGLVLDGSTPIKKRAELVKQFQADDGPPFFVISLKAGGSGLNLTAASHVIHFDRWWNPAVENQATDRAFRIGQKRNVMVHKFVCRGTVEERVDQTIADKQQLADQILEQDGEIKLTEMSNDELLSFVSLDLSRALADD